MPTSYLSRKFLVFSLVLTVSGIGISHANGPKFMINKEGQIALTASGNAFVKNVASKQVTGRLRLVTKQQAYKWSESFVKLSNRTAQKKPDFTPVNNLFRHLELCDQILNELLLAPGEVQVPLKEDEKIIEKRKEKLKAHLESLRVDLNKDIQTLVDEGSRANFIKLVSFYDKALKETLDLN